MNQHFSHSGMEVILNTQFSKIGYCYPRIFFKAGEKYSNLDLTIGHVFPMTRASWDSWFDEELEELTNDIDTFKSKLPKEWEEHHDFLFSWFSLEPKLKGVNLRPLVYLSKETVPLRTITKGLSSDGEAALKTLLKVTNSSSKAAIQAIGNIPVGEESLVMNLILDELNIHTHWGAKPNGFIGAFLLARELEDTRPQFIHFMNTVMVEKTPWFSLLISKEKWFPKN